MNKSQEQSKPTSTADSLIDNIEGIQVLTDDQLDKVSGGYLPVFNRAYGDKVKGGG